MDTASIEKAITNGEYPDSTTGGCVDFAHALGTVFDVEGYPAVFDPYDESKPLHCAAVIDETVFDGTGSHGMDSTVVQDYWSGLRPTDLTLLLSESEMTADITDDERREKMYERLTDEYYVVFDQKESLRRIGHRRSRAESYEEELRANLP